MNIEYLKERLNDLLIELDEIPIKGLQPGTFEWALVQMKSGKMPRRKRWPDTAYMCVNRFEYVNDDFLFMAYRDVDSDQVSVYTPSHEDMLAEDWVI